MMPPTGTGKAQSGAGAPPTAAGAPLLDIVDVNVQIGCAPILEHLSLQVAQGETLGVVGASGCGKSMLALAVLRLLPSAATLQGSIIFNGEHLGQSNAQMRRIRGAGIGMVFQEPMRALNPLMRIGDQIGETMRVHGSASRAAAWAAARDSLETAGLPIDTLKKLPYELSGGQRQRAALAMAVVMQPALLIADEPTTSLDVISQAQILALLADLVRRRGMGLILISHDLAVVAQLADRIAVMQQGRFIEQGAAREILQHSNMPYTRSLLAAAALQSRRRPALPLPLPLPEAAQAPVLEAEGIVLDYARRSTSLWHAAARIRAVDGVSLSVRPGETVGLVGESGSGKSSLLRVMLALQRPQAGQVRLLAESFSSAAGGNLRRLRRSIQAVFQDPYGSFDPRWTVQDLIAEPMHLLHERLRTAERSRRVAVVLEQVGLSASDAARLPHEFSGGERQRIAIARALITEPAVIAFDEAVSALDVIAREKILTLLAELATRLRLSFLFVSHDLHVVRAIADRTYVMLRGRIVEQGPTEALFASPAHAYTRALIAATPTLSDVPISPAACAPTPPSRPGAS